MRNLIRLLAALYLALIIGLIFAPEQPAAAQAAPTVNVEIKDFKFTPDNLKIKTGTKVIWANKDTIGHTVTSDTSGAFKSDLLDQNKTFEFTFTKAGTFSYHCDPHPFMVATVTVEEAVTGAAAPTTTAASATTTMPPMTMTTASVAATPTATPVLATTTSVPTTAATTAPVPTTLAATTVATTTPLAMTTAPVPAPTVATTRVTATLAPLSPTPTSTSSDNSGLLFGIGGIVILAALVGGGLFVARNRRRP